MKKDELKEQYDNITSLYDMAEELASTVESKLVKNPEEQIELVEPLINDIADSTDILAAEYIAILEEPARRKSAKARIEKSLRKIFMALENYHQRMQELSNGTLAALANIADPIVDKIYKQTEKIMLIFMRMIELSLERVMRKHELDEFKRHNDKFLSTLLQHGHQA